MVTQGEKKKATFTIHDVLEKDEVCNEKNRIKKKRNKRWVESFQDVSSILPSTSLNFQEE